MSVFLSEKMPKVSTLTSGRWVLLDFSDYSFSMGNVCSLNRSSDRASSENTQ
ncbi:hypothetical protein predicted by Glimmer/Critica [Bdellovibrio bacteriovorus HD100]|uniref:Uncharacterized protein n=1 Tax=Bdellovibrio bacteriovorus (strain ATCC 15356 / DSM 50701 / NCIMB 9529 / HD100) TaxID=264462 RepID=Q6MNS2_BDEBA|nr:hypothetical protein predicted by Glimmer/Critica [Bdellovibrio bacteriovorus HD100]